MLIVSFASGVYYRSKGHYDKAKSSKTIITVFFVSLMVLLCLRSPRVGIDTVNYIEKYFVPFHYRSWADVVKNSGGEVGFSLLVKLIASVSSNAQFFMAVVALLTTIPIMILYRNESKEAAVCCSFFMISLLFEFLFSGMRQGLALGLAVPAYYYTKKQKIIPFLLIVALAASFHMSALIMLAIYPVYHARITVKWLWAVVPAMALIYRFNRPIFQLLFQALGGKYFEKYSSLYGTTRQVGLLALFILLSVYCYVMLDEKKAEADDIGLRNLLLMATAIQFFAPLHSIVSRMNYYFILFIPLAVTRSSFKCRHMFWQIARLASLVMSLFFLFYFFFLKGDTLRIMNYSFCF